MDYHYIEDYKDNKYYRESFFELARDTFGIDFEKWYEKGFWNDQYICYSYVDQETDMVIANVSVNKMELLIAGESKQAIQLGTIMTHTNYRNKGLAKKLINIVLKKYKSLECTFLFANPSVLDFYPKFGFTRVKEYQFSMPITASNQERNKRRKLNPNQDEDLAFLIDYYRNKHIFQRVDVVNGEYLLAFYALTAFTDDIYYLEELEAIIFYKEEGKTGHLFELISKEKIELAALLEAIRISAAVTKLVFHFTPDFNGVELDGFVIDDEKESVLFVNGSFFETDSPLKFPVLSHA